MASLCAILLSIGDSVISKNNISNFNNKTNSNYHSDDNDGDITVFLSGVTRYRNILYDQQVLPRDIYRHILDLYIPPAEKWAKGKPLVIWIHGGGWQIGYKDDLMGLYGKIGSILAHKGIAFANINYRLTPRVKHPGHIQDCARAFAWLYEHAEDYGYSQDNIFISGHSAGGHLAALLASDEQWLKDNNLDANSVVAGAIPISGIYNLKNLERWFITEEENNYKPQNTLEEIEYTIRDHIPMGRGIINPFSADDMISASPVNCVEGNEPPFLIIYESASPNDFMQKQAEQMAKSLSDAGVENYVLEVKNENHLTILVDMLRPGNHTMQSIIEFINQHVDDKSVSSSPDK